MENKKYLTIRTIPKSYIQTRRYRQIRYTFTQIHDSSLSWLCTDTSMKIGGATIAA